MCAVLLLLLRVCVCMQEKMKKKKNIKRDIKREPEHMYVGVLLSHAWPDSIATGCTV